MSALSTAATGSPSRFRKRFATGAFPDTDGLLCPRSGPRLTDASSHSGAESRPDGTSRPRAIGTFSGEHYLGGLVVRHRLTPELAEAGGHAGYHIVGPWQRQDHATQMLGTGLVECRRLGIDRVLLTYAPDNEPSRKVILANGGVPDTDDPAL